MQSGVTDCFTVKMEQSGQMWNIFLFCLHCY